MRMKISGSGSIRSDGIKRTEKKSADTSGAFSKAVDSVSQADAAAPTAQTAPLTSIDALLSIQEAPTATDARSRGLASGHQMLDVLEGIRRAILLGAIPMGQLRKLAGEARRKRQSTSDPELDALLGEIELRAEVELAKYGF